MKRVIIFIAVVSSIVTILHDNARACPSDFIESYSYERLMKDLSSDVPRVRKGGLRVLCEFGRMFVVMHVKTKERLVELLDILSNISLEDEDVSVRVLAIKSIQCIPTRYHRVRYREFRGEHMALIERWIRDDDERVRIAAVESLGRTSPDYRVEMLQKSLNDPIPNVRVAVVKMLHRYKDEHNIRLIESCLYDPEEVVRGAAQKALEKIESSK